MIKDYKINNIIKHLMELVDSETIANKTLVKILKNAENLIIDRYIASLLP